ncbi:MAG TPA: MoaD/ThiS family protein [Acidimicrobiales bacterium]|nr:MoaD/ThiS family protein [Acidimicrobiales bacterium]
MPLLRVFGPARDAAGTAGEQFPGADVGAVLDAACERYGPGFADVLRRSAVWLNGEPATRAHAVGDDDEVAVLPPVSGG